MDSNDGQHVPGCLLSRHGGGGSAMHRNHLMRVEWQQVGQSQCHEVVLMEQMRPLGKITLDFEEKSPA